MRVRNILLLWFLLSVPVFATDFKFVQFDVPGALLTRPFGVNERGDIVGLYRDANGNHGFVRYVGGIYESIDIPGASFTNASSINNRGDIVGRWTDLAGNNRGYLRTRDGQINDLILPSPCVVSKLPTVPHGINDAGDIVGRCFDSSGDEHGFLLGGDGTFSTIDYPGAVTTDAWMITNSGEIVGDYSGSDGLVHGYVRTPEGQFRTVDYPAVPNTSARCINQRGDIAGVYRMSLNSNPQTQVGDQGFLLLKDKFVSVGYPHNGVAIGHLALSTGGLLVGDFIDNAGNEHGFAAIEAH